MRAILIRRCNSTLPGDTPAVLPLALKVASILSEITYFVLKNKISKINILSSENL